jgi:hypothetical protein
MVPFGLKEQELSPSTRLIAVSGELDLSVTDRLEAAIGRGAGCEPLLIGLDDCHSSIRPGSR